MLESAIRALVYEEQSRQRGALVRGLDLDSYIDKLLNQAEILGHFSPGRCEGFVAYYCNNYVSREAYISLFVVAPEARRTGLSESLLSHVVSIASARGFERLRLSVRKSNETAVRFYLRQGLVIAGDRDEEFLMERAV